MVTLNRKHVIFNNERARKKPRNTVVYIVGAFSCLPPKKTFGGFKRPKGVRGTSGRPVNIDFRFLRIFVTYRGTDLEIDIRVVHANPFLRLY